MVSNDQRRKVAARLREVETLEYDGDVWCDEGDVLDALGLYNDDDPSSCDPDEVAFLADLIDPPTCRNVADPYDGGLFECSNCGEMWEFSYGNTADNHLNFCPRCGAEVVGDD